MKLSEYKLAASDLQPYGANLHRPECVWIDDDGIWVSDGRGAISRIQENGDAEILGDPVIEPNGFSRRPDGSFIVAGIAEGKIYHVAPNGQSKVLLDAYEGQPLGAVNYCCADGQDRIWVSVMSRDLPWHSKMSSPTDDGYILRIDNDGANCEIVADGLSLTNEVKVSPDGKFLYGAESFGCRLFRFPINPDGSLGNKEIVGPASLGHGGFPDGFSFDQYGNIWVTLVALNALAIIDKQGELHTIYSDPNQAAVDEMVKVVEARNGNAEHFIACANVSGPLILPTSIAFSGIDGRDVYVGSIPMTTITKFRLPDELVL